MSNKEKQQFDEAFASALEEMGPIKKGASNPFFKSKYTSLNQVLAATLPVLRKHKFTAFFEMGYTPDGLPTIQLVLTHVPSHYHIRSVVPLIMTKKDPQAVGSAITYMRRYLWVAMFNLAAVDDDGEAAMFREPEVIEDSPTVVKAAELRKYIKKVGIATEVVVEFLGKNFGGKKLDKLDEDELQTIMAWAVLIGDEK